MMIKGQACRTRRVCDLHNDVLTSGLPEEEIKAYLNGALDDCGILTMAAWTTKSAPSVLSLKKTFEKYAEFAGEGEWSGDKGGTDNDGGKCGGADKKKGRVVFAVEDMGFLAEGGEGGAEKASDEFFTLPLVYAGPVWNNANAFGGGAFSDGGLTALGKKAVELFNSSGIALDLAHMNEKTFYAAAEIYGKPLLCSHTCFMPCVKDNAPLFNIARARNLDESRLKAIAERDGLVGLTFVAAFLNGTARCSSDDVIRHIDYFVSKFGHRHISIGTDYFGTEELPEDIKNYNNFGIITEKLSKMGYGAPVINDITGGNYERFIREKML